MVKKRVVLYVEGGGDSDSLHTECRLLNAASTVFDKASLFLKNTLCVFSFLVIRQTCSMGFRSGEYGGSITNSTASMMSLYSFIFSSTMSRLAFLCQGALSIMRAYFFPSGAGCFERKLRIDSIVVSYVNRSGFVAKSTPVPGMTNPL